MLNSLSGVPRHQGGGKVGLAEWCVLALTILFLAYFAYATPIIMVGIWHYKRHGFGDENPGEDWDPPNVSILIPVKNEEKVIGRLLDAVTRLDYPRENIEPEGKRHRSTRGLRNLSVPSRQRWKICTEALCDLLRVKHVLPPFSA